MSEPSTDRLRLIGIGAGGHGRVVLDAARAGGFDVAGFLDEDSSAHGTTVDGVPVLGGDDLLPELSGQGVTGFFLGVGSVRAGELRARVFAQARGAGLSAPAIIHPTATVSPSATIGTGAVILAQAVVGPGAVIGENAIVNTGAIVEHDSVVGAHSHVSLGAILAGRVEVGSGAFIGAGAVVRQGTGVGDGATVGAGAVVIEPVDAGRTALGVPARMT